VTWDGSWRILHLILAVAPGKVSFRGHTIASVCEDTTLDLSVSAGVMGR